MTSPPAPVALWQADGLAAFDKPPGCETTTPDGRDPARDFAARLRAATGDPAWRAVHRLDRDTSGVALFARDGEALTRGERWFRERLVEKTYLALCLGVPRNRTGVLRRALSDWGGGHRPVRVVRRGGRPAETAYRLVLGVRPPPSSAPGLGGGGGDPAGEAAADGALAAGASLVAFSPRQGRTHQIRVHAAAFGHPVLGDDQYGDRPANRAARARSGLKRQALHAWRLRPPGVEAPVESPVPDDLRAALDALAPGWADALAAFARA